MLRTWFGCSRHTYNSIVGMWKTGKEKSRNFNDLRDKYVLNQTISPEKAWLLDTPKDIRAEAVRDVCQAFATCVKKAKKYKTVFTMHYRSKKHPRESIVIPKSAIEDY